MNLHTHTHFQAIPVFACYALIFEYLKAMALCLEQTKCWVNILSDYFFLLSQEAEGEMGKVLEKAQQGPRRECILQSLLACIGLSNFCWYRTFIAGKALFKTLMLSAGKGSDTIESVFAKIHWSEL